ncbi:MAG: hypothetical protein E6Q98_25780 [Rhodospirillaceae bacterium]|nr:MAG: hypothetical protein E6Q98_25780 [Rhodospirillaceae bacterium]
MEGAVGVMPLVAIAFGLAFRFRLLRDFRFLALGIVRNFLFRRVNARQDIVQRLSRHRFS